MAKKTYIGVDGKARQVKKWYIGVDNKARKVKKGYIGVGGVARPFFTGIGEVVYYGTITSLSAAKTTLAGASVGDYALFSAGCTSNGSTTSHSTTTDAYSSALVRSSATNSIGGTSVMGANAGGAYAVFGGGRAYTETCAFNTSLTRSNGPRLKNSRWEFCTASLGNYAMFIGGLTTQTGDTKTPTVEAISASLVNTTVSDMTTGRSSIYPFAANAGDYLIISGGGSTAVDVYSSTLVKSTLDFLPYTPAAAASAGEYAIFAKGSSSTSTSGSLGSYTWAFSKDLVLTSGLAVVSPRRSKFMSASLEEHALFFGGYYPTSYFSSVDIYSSELVRSSGTNLSRTLGWCATARTGKFLLIGGGHTDSVFSPSNVVEAFQLN